MTELLEKVCPICGIVYGLERTFYEYRSKGSAAKDKKHWYCPNGHNLIVTKSKADKLQEQLDEERRRRQSAEQNVAFYADEAKREQRRANGYKGHATRISKRVKAGVCICCNRTFQDLARHMATKHPTLTPIELDQVPKEATVQ